MSSPTPRLELAFGLAFADLYARDGLERLDRAFLDALAKADAPLHERFVAARAAPDVLPYKAEAELLIAATPHVDRFIATLFGITEAWEDLHDAHHALAPLFRAKRKFVQRRAM